MIRGNSGENREVRWEGRKANEDVNEYVTAEGNRGSILGEPTEHGGGAHLPKG